jgi:hypothetical protein
MRWWAAILVLACGPAGPNLPSDVGSNHPSQRTRGDEEPPEPPAPPVEVGTSVWADYHDSGFFFHAMVVDRRELMHRVIYDDGANEWLPANALLPDSLAEDAHVHVRMTFEGEFQSATVGRRLGRAVYVRLANGDERWSTLPHVRFQANDTGTPRRGDAPRPPHEAVAPSVGADVFVNYQMQGLRFAATITARRDDGQLHVVYLDGETEWVDPALVIADELTTGNIVHVRRSWNPPQWVRGRVQERRESAIRVEFDDGGTAWTSIFRIRTPVDQSTDLGILPPVVVEEPPPPEPPAEPPPRPRRPRRRPAQAEQPAP